MEGLRAAGVSETTMMHCRFLSSSYIQYPPDVQLTTYPPYTFSSLSHSLHPSLTSFLTSSLSHFISSHRPSHLPPFLYSLTPAPYDDTYIAGPGIG